MGQGVSEEKREKEGEKRRDRKEEFSLSSLSIFLSFFRRLLSSCVAHKNAP
jgi:hypothetical protein